MFRRALNDKFPNEEEVSINARKLILAIKERPSLYDKRHPQYNNPKVKNELWNEIGQIQFPTRWRKWNKMEKKTAVCYMQKRWGNLRTTFGREVKKQIKRKELGIEGDKYVHYDLMMFLKKHMTLVIDGVTVSPNDLLDEEEPSNDFKINNNDSSEAIEVYLEEEDLDDSFENDNDSNNEEYSKTFKTENKTFDSEQSEEDNDSDDVKPKKRKLSKKFNLKRVKNEAVSYRFLSGNYNRKKKSAKSSNTSPATSTKDIKDLDNDVNFAMSLVPFLKELPASVKLQAQIDILSALKKYSDENCDK